MKQPEMKAILQDHHLWLQSDGKQGKRAYLVGASLRGADLRDADLRYTDLRDADLRYTDLQYANLEGANLQYANLRGADLQKAYLWDASLQHANLQGVKFTTNFKKVGWFECATFSEDQIPWVVLHPRYPKWAHTLTWVKAKADAA